MTLVKEIMTAKFLYVESTASIQEAAKLMYDHDVGFLPIGENDRILGTITDRDIVIRVLARGKDPETTTVKEAMTPNILYCFDEDTIESVAQNMTRNKVRRMPVINSKKRLVGVVSLGDVSHKASLQAGAALNVISKHVH